MVFHIHFIQRASVENVAQEIAFTDASNVMPSCGQDRNGGITVLCHNLPSLPDSLLLVKKDCAGFGDHYLHYIHTQSLLCNFILPRMPVQNRDKM